MLKIGHPYILLSQVSSTNNYVAEHPDLADMSDGTAILTYHQTDGRGQRDRVWKMNKGLDLAVSYLFRPNISAHRAFDINKAVTLAVRNCCASYLGDNTYIKWPNDVFLKDKKIAGILIEPSWKGSRCKHMIVGIGINGNSKGIDIPQGGTSMSAAMGEDVDLFEVFQSLNQALTEQYLLLTRGQAKNIANEFDQHLLGFGQSVELSSDEGVAKGMIKGVDDQGRLCVEHNDNVIRYSHGAITVDYSGIE